MSVRTYNIRSVFIQRHWGWLIDSRRIPTNIVICWLLIYFWTEKLRDGDSFWQTCIDGWKKCQLLHPLITWLIYQHRRRRLSADINKRWWVQVVSISNTRLQYSPIDWSIYLSTEGKNGGRDTSVVQKTAGRISWSYRKDASTGLTVARTGRTQYQQY